MEMEPSLDAELLIDYLFVEMGELPSAIEHFEQTIADPPVDLPESIVWRSRLEALLAALRDEPMCP